MGFKGFDRQKGLTDPLATGDADQLDHREEGQAAGEPQHLAVITEGRIDEAGRAKIEAIGHAVSSSPQRGLGSVAVSTQVIARGNRQGSCGAVMMRARYLCRTAC